MATPAHATSERYHAILFANDNISRQVKPGGGFVYMEPPEYEKGLSRPARPFADAPDTGLPLHFTERDVTRMERLLQPRTDPRLMTTLLPSHVGPWLPATPDAPARGPSTRDAVEAAFVQTGCRIAALRGRPREGCPPLPAGLSPEKGVKDVVFVHYSGHGTKKALLLYDRDLLAPDLQRMIADLDASLVVLILDACYGSGFPDVDLSAVRGGPRVAVFKGTNPLPEVAELRTGGLSHIVLSGLSGAADDNADRRITFAELADFFHLNSAVAGEFVGRAESPGGNQRRTLFELGASGSDEVEVTVDRRLGGRVLFTEPDGGVPAALAEVNVQRRGLQVSPTVHLRLPRTRQGTYDVYYLAIDRDGDALAPVRSVVGWDPAVEERSLVTPSGRPAPGDAVTRYLVGSQAERGMFSRQSAPLATRAMGTRFGLYAFAGYQISQAIGRIEDADVSDSQNPGVSDLYAYLQEREPEAWNLVDIGLVGRLHLPTASWLPLAVEARADLGFSPRASAAGTPSAVLVGRALAGGGVSGHLGSRAWTGGLSAGAGGMLVGVDPLEPGGDSFRDPSAWTSLYAGGSLTLDLPVVAVAFELLALHDVVPVWVLDTEGRSDERRGYWSGRASIGVRLREWPP